MQGKHSCYRYFYPYGEVVYDGATYAATPLLLRFQLRRHAAQRDLYEYHKIRARKVSVGMFDSSRGVLATCSCGKTWAR